MRTVIISMPRAGSVALLGMLGGKSESDASVSLEKGQPTEPVCRAQFFGHQSKEDAFDKWGRLTEQEGTRLILLARAEGDLGQYEFSLNETWRQWQGKYGDCAGKVLKRVRAMRGWMQEFADTHPSAILIWQHEVEDFDALNDKVSVSRTLWEEQCRLRPCKVRDRSPFGRGQPDTAESAKKDPFANYNPADPFADEDLKDPDAEARKQLVAKFKPKKPRKFIEFPSECDRAVVIPWVPWHANDDLRISLRSIHQHFTDRECPIYLIGATPPPWLRSDGRIRWRTAQTYVHSLRAGQWDALVTGLQLADKVLWFNDDIMLLKPVGWEDFETALTEGSISDNLVSLSNSERGWFKNMANVGLQLLQKDPERKVRRFSTHTPMLFEREKSIEVLRSFYIPFSGGFENAYYNHHNSLYRPAKPFKTGVLPAKPQHQFLNWGSSGQPKFETRARLAAMFPEPAPWEKLDAPAIVVISIDGHMPHLAEMLEHNPDAEWYEDRAPKVEGAEWKRRWRNGDVRFYDWWKANRDRVKADRIAFVEWDVRIPCKLEHAFPPGPSFGCARVEPGDGEWGWLLAEKKKIPAAWKSHVCGTNPLAAVVFTRQALDDIVALTDDLPDVYCEIRLATLGAMAGHRPQPLATLGNVNPTQCLNLEGVVSHPVKS